MITLKKCRELLDKKKEKYTDQQLEVIRKFLIRMAKMNLEYIKNLKNKKDEKSSNNE